MATKGISIDIEYMAWDVANNIGISGDDGNHTLRIIRDGIVLTPINTPVAIADPYCQGLYTLTLTASEMNGDYIVVTGTSISSGVIILPVSISTMVAGGSGGGSDCTDDGITYGTRQTPIPYLGDPNYPEPPY